MSLTNKERAILVAMQMEKAHAFLKQADEMMGMRYWDIAANRYYYASLHAVQALLLNAGISCHSHNGIIANFGLNFIKTGKISSHLGSFFSRMEQLRQKGDYNCMYTVSEEEVFTMKEPAHELIEAIRSMLNL